ncbi:pilus assembly protein [Candidatus Pelagibacter sp.]|nr:pilus assembly protein [Candidatus Pelagibacter sp.]
MKKIHIGLLSIFILFSSLSMSMACEFLKEQIGTSVSSIIDKYDYLDEPPEYDIKTLTFYKMYESNSLCENFQLKNTFITVFIREGKIIALELSGMPGEAKGNRILNFTKTNLGYSTDQVINDEWIGAINMSTKVNMVLYGRVQDFNGIYEQLIISKEDYFELLNDPDIVEIF